MKRDFEFYGSACSHCEQDAKEGIKPTTEIIWSINCCASDGGRRKRVGWMRESQITGLSVEGKIERSLSTVVCPPCMLATLGLSSIECLRNDWKTRKPKEIYQIMDRDLRLWERYLKTAR
jgi:hypothetical protein